MLCACLWLIWAHEIHNLLFFIQQQMYVCVCVCVCVWFINAQNNTANPKTTQSIQHKACGTWIFESYVSGITTLFYLSGDWWTALKIHVIPTGLIFIWNQSCWTDTNTNLGKKLLALLCIFLNSTTLLLKLFHIKLDVYDELLGLCLYSMCIY